MDANTITTHETQALVAAMAALARIIATATAPPPRRQGPTPELVTA